MMTRKCKVVLLGRDGFRRVAEVEYPPCKRIWVPVLPPLRATYDEADAPRSRFNHLSIQTREFVLSQRLQDRSETWNFWWSDSSYTPMPALVYEESR
jgi:hypothetical protein